MAGTASQEITAARRYEVKYVVSEVQALEVRDFIAPFVVEDSHNLEYPITSLYLDGPALPTLQSSCMGEKNRFKLRIRAYSDAPEDPVFCEAKQREDRIIRKKRIVVRREAVPPLLGGARARPEFVAEKRVDAALGRLHQFVDLIAAFAAAPRVAVRYIREAWMAASGEPVRVSFDRTLSCLPATAYTPAVWSPRNPWREVFTTPAVWSAPYAWRSRIVAPVIMEIKFTDQCPSWVNKLVQRCHLIPDSVCKYAECARLLLREGETLEVPDRECITWIV